MNLKLVTKSTILYWVLKPNAIQLSQTGIICRVVLMQRKQNLLRLYTTQSHDIKTDERFDYIIPRVDAQTLQELFLGTGCQCLFINVSHHVGCPAMKVRIRRGDGSTLTFTLHDTTLLRRNVGQSILDWSGLLVVLMLPR